MIICPSCHHEEMVGALFCSECGAQLTYYKTSPTETFLYTKSTDSGAAPNELPSVPPPAQVMSRVILRIFETGQIIPLEGNQEFTLGRISGSQPILPDVDLTPYQAYEEGISRLHATIRVGDDLVTVADLGSANGTRVNGEKIPAHEPRALKDGDMLTLGKFKLQVIVRR